MRVMVARIHPIRVHGAQILDLQLDERFGELGGVAELDSEFVWSVSVSFLFVFSKQG
jgi:hypothetical protein